MKRIDLHIHTNLSDGLLSPREIVQLASDNNCSTISIADHETITDFQELGKEYNMEIIPGIEFNTAISSMHILGYGISNLSLVNDKMTELAKKNEQVCYQVIDLMQKKGYDISVEKVIHYIKEINLKSDILDKRRIVKYLIYKGYVTSTLDAYDKLIGQKTEFYVPNYKIAPEGIISLIQASGGIAVLAHPYTIKLPKNMQYELIKELVRMGLIGIEIFNGNMEIENKTYIEIADELGLVKTIGSDFHDPKISTIGFDVDDDMYNRFKEKIKLKK